MASEFWSKTRLAMKAVSQVFNGRATTEAIKHATPLQRAFAAGAVPGQPVSNKWEELGHNTSWNYVGVHTVAKMWALASWNVTVSKRLVTKSHDAQDAQTEERKTVPNHPLMKLLDKPNPMMSRMQFMYIIGTHLRLTGGWSILEIRGKESHKPVELYPIPRAWMTALPPTDQHPMGEYQILNPRGMTGYWGHSPLASGFRVDARDMLISGWPHQLYPGEQISPLSACGRIIDIMEQMDLAVWSSLLNAYHNGMILLMDPKAIVDESALKQIAKTVENTKGGSGNAGKVSALQGVASIERSTVSLTELSAVEVREQNMRFGLGIQGVPNVATGVRNEIGSYAGDTATINTFAEWGVQPDLDLFAGCMTNRMRNYYGDDIQLEANAKRADDPQLKAQKRSDALAAYEAGVATKNEVRIEFDWDPVADGDEFKQPEVQPGMVGPDGQPMDPNAMGGGDDDLGLDMDLPDLADDEGPNIGNPALSRAGGRSFAPTNGRA